KNVIYERVRKCPYSSIHRLMAIVILQGLSAGQNKVITKRKENMKSLIAFFEIPVTDFYQSVNFYQMIFGVKLMVAENNTFVK
ncbi:MAG TPA: hypothetical protein H9778_00745, partial [Candidatus Parabacteroides intestinavium]|nr:hypothetical protein [Candidatus Parabacteroides intestinavium]